MNILVISPHADDEVLGCGAYIMRMAEQGHKVDVVIGCVGNYVNSLGVDQDPNQKKAEIMRCHQFMGVNDTQVLWNLESRLDTLPESEVVATIDGILNQKKYDQVFIPYRSNHVDHKVLHDSCLASLRLKAGRPMETEVYFYEYPFITGYDQISGGAVYHEMTEKELDNKVRAFQFYESQIKEFPSPLNREGITTLSRMRGMEAGLKYAEKFYLRHVIIRSNG